MDCQKTRVVYLRPTADFQTLAEVGEKEVEERRVDVLALVLVPSLLFFLVVVASFFFRVCFKMTE